MASTSLKKYIDALMAPITTALGNTQSLIQSEINSIQSTASLNTTLGLNYSWESGTLSAGQVISNPAVPFNITLTGTGYAGCDYGLASPTTIPIYEDLVMYRGSIVSGTSIGSVAFPSGSTTGTITLPQTTIAAGHHLGIVALTAPDLTFENPQITLIGHR